MEAACESVGRDPASVTLIAVSKTHPADAIREAYDHGLRHFGESRLQELEPKAAALPADITWHFIGHLQSNKAKRVAAQASAIHTLFNAGQLREIEKAGHPIDGLIEVNIAEEPQKSGLLLSGIDDFTRTLLDCKQILFRGLMTIGPALDEMEQMRPYFCRMREVNERIGGQWLSMGMSHDFEVAIQEGSTHVRIGTALFGAR